MPLLTAGRKAALLTPSPFQLLTNSDALNGSGWTRTRSNVTADAAAGPFGGFTADKLYDDSTATSTHFITQVVSGTAPGLWMLGSIYAKADARTRLALAVTNSLDANIGISYFDLTAGSVLLTVSGSARITPAGGGYWRCEVRAGSVSDGTTKLRILLVNTGTNTSYSGDGASGLYLAAAQLGPNPFGARYVAK